jgi:magnesium chelatase subunit D
VTGWADAVAAARLLVHEPGLGAVVRAPAGPVRDAWLALLRALPTRRLPPSVGEDRLLGGLDVAATLHAGRPVAERGLLEAGGTLLLHGADRLPAATAALLAQVLDTQQVLARDGRQRRVPVCLALVALDEGAAPLASALLDRLALRVDLSELSWRDLADEPAEDATDDAWTDDPHAAWCGAAASLGIASLRAPLLALAASRAAASLAGRAGVTREDAELAARLVLAPRATLCPPDPAQPPAPPPPTETPAEAGEAGPETDPGDALPQEMLVQAARAVLPAGLLEAGPQGGAARRAALAGRSGAATPGRLRGRPAGVRPGLPRGGARLALLATLRAAAPWQRLRAGDGAGVKIRRADLRVQRRQQRTETVIVFVVDASGSAAFGRLAEAKGAVELLLAECYVRRDRVALIAFRDRAAALLLPPTRSLTRARRSLAALPGGGGTPLAAGLEAARLLCRAERARGAAPTLLLLTDGQANVALDGSVGRAQAGQDGLAAARRLRADGVRALLVDVSPRPQPAGRALAEGLGARYLALPYADAAALSRAALA